MTLDCRSQRCPAGRSIAALGSGSAVSKSLAAPALTAAAAAADLLLALAAPPRPPTQPTCCLRKLFSLRKEAPGFGSGAACRLVGQSAGYLEAAASQPSSACNQMNAAAAVGSARLGSAWPAAD